MKKSLGTALVTAAVAVSVVVPSISQGAAAALPDSASVRDAVGDEEVVYGKAPRISLDVAKVRYRSGKKESLRVAVLAEDIRPGRVSYTEHFSVATYTRTGFHDYTVHHRADGGLRVIDFTATDGTISKYRVPGTFSTKPAEDKAVFVIPLGSIGDPTSVTVSGGSFLKKKGTGNIKTLDFTEKGRRISLR